MFGFGKNKKHKEEATTDTGEYTRKIEESVDIIESMVKKDIRLFFNDFNTLETLVSKFKNGEINPAMGMMALEPTKANMAKAKLACEKIKKIYKA